MKILDNLAIHFRSKMNRAKEVLQEQKGISTVELILVLVVIIGLVVIFKSQMTSLVQTIFEKITSESSGI